jgi:hypothetical protein
LLAADVEVVSGLIEPQVFGLLRDRDALLVTTDERAERAVGKVLTPTQAGAVVDRGDGGAAGTITAVCSAALRARSGRTLV